MLDQITLSTLTKALADAPDARIAVARLLRELATSLSRSLDPDKQLDHRRRAHDFTRIADLLAEPEPPLRALREEIDTLRERLVLDALRRTKNNVARAARALGVSRNLIYEVIDRASNDGKGDVLPP